MESPPSIYEFVPFSSSNHSSATCLVENCLECVNAWENSSPEAGWTEQDSWENRSSGSEQEIWEQGGLRSSLRLGMDSSAAERLYLDMVSFILFYS